MYKPNGEEPMTKQEEARRRAVLAERTRRELKPESQDIRSAFYAALFGAAQTAEESIAYTQAR
jgi:hypothetical protein